MKLREGDMRAMLKSFLSNAVNNAPCEVFFVPGANRLALRRGGLKREQNALPTRAVKLLDVPKDADRMILRATIREAIERLP